MPEIAQAGDIYQARLVGRMNGTVCENVLHFKSLNGDTDVALHLIQVLIDCFVQNLLPVLSSAYHFSEVVWQKVSAPIGVEQHTQHPGLGIGGGNANALPTYCSVVFSKRTLLGGKEHRGRFYLPGIPEDQTNIDEMDIGLPFWAGAVAFAACVLQNFKPGDPPAANSWSIGVYSRKLGGAKFPYTAAGFTPLENFFPEPALGTTRSRKLGRGM